MFFFHFWTSYWDICEWKHLNGRWKFNHQRRAETVEYSFSSMDIFMWPVWNRINFCVPNGIATHTACAHKHTTSANNKPNYHLAREQQQEDKKKTAKTITSHLFFFLLLYLIVPSSVLIRYANLKIVNYTTPVTNCTFIQSLHHISYKLNRKKPKPSNKEKKKKQRTLFPVQFRYFACVWACCILLY